MCRVLVIFVVLVSVVHLQFFLGCKERSAVKQRRHLLSHVACQGRVSAAPRY